jgi:uncharacterized protein YigE (DUF2233 family)
MEGADLIINLCFPLVEKETLCKKRFMQYFKHVNIITIQKKKNKIIVKARTDSDKSQHLKRVVRSNNAQKKRQINLRNMNGGIYKSALNAVVFYAEVHRSKEYIRTS